MKKNRNIKAYSTRISKKEKLKNSFFEKASKFVVDNPKIIKSLFKIKNYNDEPQLYQYCSQFIDKQSQKLSKESIASGTSFNKNRALLKLLGETIERYALGINSNKNFIYKSFNQIVSSQKMAYDPNKLAAFPLYKRGVKVDLSDTKLHWIEGKSLVTNKNTFIPAQLVFVPYLHQRSEFILQMPMSTGAAAGESLTDAIYRGVCEVIERDSFMIHYFNEINSPKINLNSIKNRYFHKIKHILERYNLKLYVNDITTDIDIPAVISILIDQTGKGPAVSVGLKAGFNIVEDIIGSIEEALMVRSWVRDEFIYLKPKYKKNKLIRTIEDRANFWFPKDTIKYLSFWLKNNNKIKPRYFLGLKSTEDKLSEIIKILKKKQIDIIYVDLTYPDVKSSGAKVVKVIIPALQPLFLDDKYPYFSFDRLYQTPVKMGLFNKIKERDELNKIPHPFL